MDDTSTTLAPRWTWPLSIALGAAFAWGLHRAWELEGRWFYVVIAAIAMVSVSLFFIRRLADFLLVALLFCIPLGSFTKWFFLDAYPSLVANAIPYSGGFGIGLTDFVLAGAYLIWFLRIFAGRVTTLPTLHGIDYLILLVIVAYALSIPGTPAPSLGLFSLYYFVVHAAGYFYLSRHLRREHVVWLLLSVAFAISLEASIGFVQYRYGMFAGLALDKGKGGEDLNFQYEVPGMEDTVRATGTLYDSHALGTYAAMLGVIMFMWFFNPNLSGKLRLLIGPLFLLAMMTTAISYSRSAWVSCAVGLSLLAVISLLYWREGRILPSMFVLGFMLIPALPWLTNLVYERFTSAPSQILSVRQEGYGIAFDIWKAHPLLGFGVGNYMNALDTFNLQFAEELPVHNAILWIMAESGLLGLCAFGGLVFSVLRRLWRFTLSAPDPLRRLSAGALAALVIYVTDAMSNPLYRDLVLFKMFWLCAALAVALPRMLDEAAPRAA